jgi:two-component system NtrC family response regulator
VNASAISASGNQSEAARRLGVSRVGLIKKLARLGLK